MTPPRAVPAVVLALALLLAGCTRPVEVEPGEYAADPVCGQVIVALPQELNGQSHTPTTAQATVAWGTDSPIVLRCGVEPPPPSDERCIAVTSPAGVEIDWLAPEGDSELIPKHAQVDTGAWTFITYGRTPAIELVIPAESGISEPLDILNSLALAVDNAPAERFCVGATDY